MVIMTLLMILIIVDIPTIVVNFGIPSDDLKMGCINDINNN